MDITDEYHAYACAKLSYERFLTTFRQVMDKKTFDPSAFLDIGLAVLSRAVRNASSIEATSALRQHLSHTAEFCSSLRKMMEDKTSVSCPYQELDLMTMIITFYEANKLLIALERNLNRDFSNSMYC